MGLRPTLINVTEASEPKPPLRVVVADDEPLARERIVTLVREARGMEVVGEARNGLDALNLVSRTQPDVILIDVEMPELSGFEVVAAFEPERAPAVVFITAYEHYAVRAFDVGAVDYLHKPVTPARFDAAMRRIQEKLAHRLPSEWQRIAATAEEIAAEQRVGYQRRFVIRRGNTHHFIPIDDIDWIDTADNYLRLHVAATSHLWRGTMQQAVDRLDPVRFTRVHRSAIVAVDRIATVRARPIGGLVLTMTSGAQVEVSRQYAEKIWRLLR